MLEGGGSRVTRAESGGRSPVRVAEQVWWERASCSYTYSEHGWQKTKGVPMFKDKYCRIRKSFPTPSRRKWLVDYAVDNSVL